MNKALLPLIIILFFTSCSKKDVDIRDQYVGTWQYQMGIVYATIQNGRVVETIADENYDYGTVTISKSDENGLSINGQIFRLEGNQLISVEAVEGDDYTPQRADVYFSTVLSGQLRTDNIVLQGAMTGSWIAGVYTGPIEGTVRYTLTR